MYMDSEHAAGVFVGYKFHLFQMASVGVNTGERN